MQVQSSQVISKWHLWLKSMLLFSNCPGPKVISKTIPLASIEELGKVLQRPPVIWDNLHANDYDQKRLFLGPYIGRSVALLPKLNGVLTNPNCEYGASYVAMHTMAQWSRCATVATKRPSPARQAMQLEMEGRVEEATESGIVKDDQGFATESEFHLYEPKLALDVTLKEWILEFKLARRKPEHYNPVKDETSVAKAKDLDQLSLSSDDCVDVRKCPSQVAECLDLDLDEGVTPISTEPFTLDDLRLMVDFFYLPHQHGERSLSLLEEFCWLKENAPSCDALRANGKLRGGGESRVSRVDNDGMRSDGEASDSVSDEDMTAAEVGVSCTGIMCQLCDRSCDIVLQVVQWYERTKKFHEACDKVGQMYDRLTAIPNRPLLYDLYRYAWDAKETTDMLNSYITWLGMSSMVNGKFSYHQVYHHSNLMRF